MGITDVNKRGSVALSPPPPPQYVLIASMSTRGQPTVDMYPEACPWRATADGV